MKNQDEMRFVAIGDHKARGWIQWKGTDVCIDIHCECGKMSHLDSEFAYNIECGYCGKIYQANPNIRLELIENPDEETKGFAKLTTTYDYE